MGSTFTSPEDAFEVAVGECSSERMKCSFRDFFVVGSFFVSFPLPPLITLGVWRYLCPLHIARKKEYVVNIE